MNTDTEKQSELFEIKIEGGYEHHLGGPVGDSHSEWYDGKEYLDALYKLKDIAKSCELNIEDKTRPLENNRFTSRKHYYDGGMDTQYVVNITCQAASCGVLSYFLKKAADVIVEMIKLRGSRGVTLKAGEYTVEIKGSSDVAAAMKALQELEVKFPLKDKGSAGGISDVKQPSPTTLPTSPPNDDSRYMPKG